MFGVAPTITFTWSGVTSGKTSTRSFKATHLKIISGTDLTCDVNILRDAVQGLNNIMVKDTDGQTDTLKGGFEVKAGPVPAVKPVIKRLSKEHLRVGSPALSLIVTGSNFLPGTKTSERECRQV